MVTKYPEKNKFLEIKQISGCMGLEVRTEFCVNKLRGILPGG